MADCKIFYWSVTVKTLMIQGTGSSVGKSVIAAGLCKIFSDLGYKVTPFKSQNMALNSFITKDGKEMGRAQVVQAEAAGIEPHSDMNPILIKPNSDTGAQIIIHGKVYGNMSAKDYHSFKKEAKNFVIESFNRLKKNFDIMIIEGAGSPAEINLMDNDIVNMGMAEIADAPVILAGDIDKGGVFASLVGTIELLPDIHKNRVKAFLINKFRGDKTLLQPGLDSITSRTNIPFIGVIPYMKDLYIQEEDGVVVENYLKNEINLKSIKVAILKLPHISNFTDFDAFSKEPDVSTKYIEIGDSLEQFDILIIPGSKNTIEDLSLFRSKNFIPVIEEFVSHGKTLIGVCGGFQMLGLKIFDPYHVESNLDNINGLGFLKFTTTMEREKTTKQVKVRTNNLNNYFAVEDILEGYEIHMGKNDCFEKNFIFKNIDDNSEDGLFSENGNIWGTYIHGIFDNDSFRRKIINSVRVRKGLKTLQKDEALKYASMKKSGFEKLALCIKENIDIKMLNNIIFK